MSKGVLIDLTKCIGCGSCAVACKMWNKLEFNNCEPYTGPDAKLHDLNWTVVSLHTVDDSRKEPVWRYVKQQCFHCQEPACVSACFSRALERNADGAVIYYPSLCVGCRYCMIACPFDIPKYEWSKRIPHVTKCQFCSQKIAAGESPACVSVCPTGALQYGDRSQLLAEGKRIIAADSKYVDYIYGEKEVGGTAWMYLSDVPFEELGFKMGMSDTALPAYTNKFVTKTPVIAAGWGAALLALSFYTKRRNRLAKERSRVRLTQKAEQNPDKTGGKREDHES
ncbi:MAG: 4Fe-4S dicluster domain-containing protein [Veillonellales bacterium]